MKLWKGSGNSGLIDTIKVAVSGTLPASGTGTLKGTYTIPTGYSAAGIVGYNLATYSLSTATVNVAGNTVTIAVKNTTTSAITPSGAYAIVLLVCNSAS